MSDISVRSPWSAVGDATSMPLIKFRDMGDGTFAPVAASIGQRAYSVALSTNTAGVASATLSAIGRVHSIGIIIGSLATTADVTITDTLTGAAVLTLTNVAASGLYYPRVPVQDASGANIASNYTAPVSTGALTIAVAQGGTSTAGTLLVIVES